MIFRAAVQRHCQDSRNGRFADTPVAAENVPVGDALLLDGILQRASDMVLPNHIGELLRTVFSGKDLIAHCVSSIINGRRIDLDWTWISADIPWRGVNISGRGEFLV